MLRLLYGGTFDPVHRGHLAIARAARDQLGCAVNLMPAADPPHRAPPGADAGQRTRMLELAVEGERGLQVDLRELQREGRSYTIDTLREVRSQVGPRQPLALLIGADSFLGLPSWRNWQDLFDLTHFVVAPRPGSALSGGLAPALARAAEGRWTAVPADLTSSSGGRLFLLDHAPTPESASEIRSLIADGLPWEHLVVPAVARFITQNGLYSRHAPGPGPL